MRPVYPKDSRTAYYEACWRASASLLTSACRVSVVSARRARTTSVSFGPSPTASPSNPGPRTPPRTERRQSPQELPVARSPLPRSMMMAMLDSIPSPWTREQRASCPPEMVPCASDGFFPVAFRPHSTDVAAPGCGPKCRCPRRRWKPSDVWPAHRHDQIPPAAGRPRPAELCSGRRFLEPGRPV